MSIFTELEENAVGKKLFFLVECGGDFGSSR
jgi:hypothetical protein